MGVFPDITVVTLGVTKGASLGLQLTWPVGTMIRHKHRKQHDELQAASNVANVKVTLYFRKDKTTEK